MSLITCSSISRNGPRQPPGETEIHEGREQRHDLAGIAAGHFEAHLFGHALVAGMLADRLGHLAVIDQPLDQVVATGELEWLDRTGEPRVQSRHSALHPATKKPADRGEQEMRRQRHGGEGEDQDEQPERQFNRLCHGRVMPKPRHPGKRFQKRRHQFPASVRQIPPERIRRSPATKAVLCSDHSLT